MSATWPASLLALLAYKSMPSSQNACPAPDFQEHLPHQGGCPFAETIIECSKAPLHWAPVLGSRRLYRLSLRVGVFADLCKDDAKKQRRSPKRGHEHVPAKQPESGSSPPGPDHRGAGTYQREAGRSRSVMTICACYHERPETQQTHTAHEDRCSFLVDSSCLYDFDSMLSTAIQRHGNLREGSSGSHPFRTIQKY